MNSINTFTRTPEGHSSACNASKFFSILQKPKRKSVRKDGLARHLILEEKWLHLDELLRVDVLLSPLIALMLQTDTNFLQNTKRAKGK